jgi:5-oxoprolinase (ATP-hydrolysing) subunit B
VRIRLETSAMDVLTVRLFDAIDEANLGWIMAADRVLREALGAAAIDLVPSYTTLMVHFDGVRLEVAEARGRILAALEDLAPDNLQAGRRHEIPVWYDVSVGPDLTRLAERSGLSVAEVVERHCARDYHVFALGFAPGYGFMGLVEEALATPRLGSPRRRVAAGSVGIADRQTAIYPLASPGGWNILGRTALPLFERARDGDPLLRPGDRVRFVAIDRAAFEAAGGDATPLEDGG